jgi:hypothetical protein
MKQLERDILATRISGGKLRICGLCLTDCAVMGLVIGFHDAKLFLEERSYV